MDLKTLMLINIIQMLAGVVCEYGFVRIVSGEKSKRRNTWLIYLLTAVALSAIISYLTLPQLLEKSYFEFNGWIAVYTLISNISILAIHYYVFAKISPKIIYFLTVFASTLYTLIDMSYVLIIKNIFFEQVPAECFIVMVLLENIIVLSGVLGILWLLKKLHMIEIFNYSFYHPQWALTISLILAGLQIVIQIVSPIFNLQEKGRVVIILFFYAVQFFAVIFLSREYLREQRLRKSEALVTQQAAYLQKLETIQQDLQKMQHDYKNVAMGAYAKVEAGDLADAQEYIATQMLQMDETLQLDIKQLNQLANLQVVELKTLIMTKIMEAEKQGVVLAIEILAPINKIPMEIADLLRCSGIILDNAIEAAAMETDKQVNVILLKEKNQITFVVKNPISHEIDMQRIWGAGYSTKGKNRGLGLVNLREIVRRYPDVTLETRVEEQSFVQILMFLLK
ncbi:two-component system sensor histidine kinase AgrC [Enterococcus sp. PF1-24]|uniref:sensor histidine kinase n=1 Tax=unclassified Enterococcus TaxID=2608891 RepID=UPI002473641F|nr:MULTISPECIES: GHKL domain-containing protein [unclassified Enterococcus]MDH6363734.1 two-component system sensor histidine kinase AgrC [Enterococcus sp. PFB1-1]MDH6400690.1 two-component system sensor histidine kinase AgrC [Enterococcus sp. PF1-24]